VEAAVLPGTIPGAFGVSDQGAGQYTIPIETVAATGGLKPNLALTYNHLAGNGLAGMRWTLSGFSAITRCQQTYAQDGTVVAIAYDASDRFCLDGQRLVNASVSESYGANNTEYRTEIETFQKVKSYGTAGSGPSYFTIQHGNGLISYYGYASDSKIERVGESDVRIWYISYTEDQFGNRISYGYDENTSTGEVLPDEVTWTSNSGQGLSARYSVTINYGVSPAPEQRDGRDSDGAEWARTKRITSIEVEYNGTEIGTYDLSYSSNSITNRSQLDDVTLSRGSDSLPATTFTWQDGDEGWNTATDTNRAGGSDPLIGDFNNDGNMDIFVNLSGTWQVYPGTDAGNLGAAINSNQSSTTNPAQARVLDFDGDGKSDLLYQSGSTWYTMKSNGTSWASPVSTGVSTSTVAGSLTQDFDGDGLEDWVYMDGSNNVKWKRNTGGAFASAATLMSSVGVMMGEYPNLPRADFNGDGRTDLFYGTYSNPPPPNLPTMTAYSGLASGSVYTSLEQIASATYPDIINDLQVADINGDGLTDVAYALSSTGKWYIRLAEGHEGLGNATNTTITATGIGTTIVADYNNDGRDDLLRYVAGTFYVHLSTGTSWESSASTYFSGEKSLLLDISGDGNKDLAYVSGGDWHIRTHKSDLPDVVTTFTNGLGYGIDVTYESLADTASDHYNFDLTDNPPGPYVQRFHGARYVVTHEDHDDGIGGTHNYKHAYDTAFLDRSGRGWLSFDWHVRTDLDRGVNSATWFRQDWPYAGTPELSRTRRTSDNLTISESNPAWDKTTTTSTTPDIHFIRVESMTSKDWEVGGADDGDLVRTVVNNPTYNTTYGYVEERTVTTTDPSSYTWTTHTDYDPTVDTDDWCLGLPGLVTTTNTNPDSSYATRKLDHVFNSADCSLTSTTDTSEASTAKQLKTSFTYDGFGNPNVVSTDSVDTSAQNRSIDYDYDSWGHFVTSETVGTDGLNVLRTWDYVNAQPASVTGPDGLPTSYSYDSFGRLASVDTPTIDTTYTYEACTSCFHSDAVYFVKADHSDGNDEYQYFDALNRSVATAWTLPGGTQGRSETDYNALGQVDRVSQPYVSTESKYWVSYEYDLIGRILEEDAPVSESVTSGAITAYEYLGETIKVTDAEGNVTQRVHNAVGQVVQVIDAASNDADYEYAPFGELNSLTDAEGNVTDIDYDARGFKTTMDDPNMGDWSYAYSIYGELTSQTNALSQTTTLSFDEAGRLKTRVEPEGTTTWYYFPSGTGAKGKVSSITAPDSYEEQYSYYSATGLPAEVRRRIDGTWYDFDMTYDGYGRLNVLTYPTSTSGYQFKTDYDYDSYGHLSAINDGNETYTYYTLDETDALGRERDVSLGNGRSEAREYDEAAGYLKSIATDNSVQDLEFTYDEVGNVLTRFDDLIDETETFTYDGLNRLATSYVTGESTVTVTYSAAGRVLTKTGCTGTWTYGAGVAGPFAVTNACGSSYTYDANGRMITRGGDDITWYSYDKPKKIESGSQSAEFWYGPDRSRYKQEQRTSGSLDATIRYVGSLFEFEDPASGSDVYRHYVHAGSRVVALVERIGTTNTKKFLHRDNQGSVTKVTNSAGSVSQALAFDAWGLRRDPTDWSSLGSPFSGSHETERGYTGHEHLDNVGLIHMNGRVQDPVLGRFISADPFVPNHNRYSYVRNNPTSLIDPSGFTEICVMFPSDMVLICPNSGGEGSPGCNEDCRNEFFEHMWTQFWTMQGYDSSNANEWPTGGPGSGGSGSGGGGSTGNGSGGGGSTGNGSAGTVSGGRIGTPPAIGNVWTDRIRFIGSMVVGFSPLGSGADLYTAVFGTDPVSGERVSGFWRLAGVIPGVSEARKAGKVFDAVRDVPSGGRSAVGIGERAGESITARSSARNFSTAERAEINRIGSTTGCHTCGTTNPGTRTGNFVPDHQPANALNTSGGPQRLYPQCISCSREQGLELARRARQGQQ
jgi:RHS repeat-associated protein